VPESGARGKPGFVFDATAAVIAARDSMIFPFE